MCSGNICCVTNWRTEKRAEGNARRELAAKAKAWRWARLWCVGDTTPAWLGVTVWIGTVKTMSSWKLQAFVPNPLPPCAPPLPSLRLRLPWYKPESSSLECTWHSNWKLLPTELVLPALWSRGDYIWVTDLIGTVSSNGNALKESWVCPSLPIRKQIQAAPTHMCSVY